MSCSSPEDVPQAKQGVLNLQDWDWEENEEIALNGEWGFYWQKFVSPQLLVDDHHPPDFFAKVPGRWRQSIASEISLSATGYATYSLKVQLPADSVPLSLRVNTASTAMKIWVNGKEVYHAGKVAVRAEDATPAFEPDIVSIPIAQTLDIVIFASNYHYRKGGLWDNLILGTTNAVTKSWIKNYAVTFFLIGSFIIMALYHIILYLHRRRDKSSLYFSIFCLLIIIRTLSTDLYILSDFLPWGGVVKAELLSFYLCIPVFAAFAQALYPTIIPRWFMRFSVSVTFVFSAIVLLIPMRWSSYTVIPFEIFAVGLSTFGLYRIATTNWRQLDGILIFVLGFLGVFVTLVNDALFANNLINTFFAAPFGLFIFLFSQSSLLSRRFSRAANDLEHSNTQLEHRNQQVEEKNEALIKLNQEMDVFVYRTSHDLRAPLTSLLGIISLMRNQPISTELVSYLDLQERSIYKLDGFVREILDYSRNSRLAVEPQFVDFRTLIEETNALYTHLPQYEKIDKRIIINQTVPYGGDKKRMEVIFNNLVSNALRYYNPYEEEPYIQITIEVNEFQATVQVEDNGLGIASQHLERIFEMFYRASNHQDSSGLGLFLVKETVEKMKGTIKVESTVNEGTLFTVSLPNHSVKETETQPS